MSAKVRMHWIDNECGWLCTGYPGDNECQEEATAVLTPIDPDIDWEGFASCGNPDHRRTVEREAREVGYTIARKPSGVSQ
ncbi:MAG TPA: hypothetical protein VGK83_05155 [Acidimicrobiia bacterium]